MGSKSNYQLAPILHRNFMCFLFCAYAKGVLRIRKRCFGPRQKVAGTSSTPCLQGTFRRFQYLLYPVRRYWNNVKEASEQREGSFGTLFDKKDILFHRISEIIISQESSEFAQIRNLLRFCLVE